MLSFPHLLQLLNFFPVIILFIFIPQTLGQKALEAQLYEDLLYDYNKIPRPVKNSSEVLLVDVGASLIRIIDVDEKNQVLTTNLWLEMKWEDAKLKWDPKRYGGINALHIPSDLIWTPDLVLYNNAAGDPDITIFTDALVSYDGRVFWNPPAIYKSFCPIDVTWFPYDSQNCNMKFGAWSYTGYYVDLRQLPKDEDGTHHEFMQNGMDLSFFYTSAEWDLLSLTSARHSVLYASCCGPEKYVDITYYFELRRKTLFYTSNLIIPCFLISFLTTFVFYLSNHKITFSISILVTLTVFFLVLIDIIPPTSLVIPMFGRYLITTMILVALSTMVSVVTVNFRFRSGAAHQMSPWIRSIFLKCLPRLLFMRRPEKSMERQRKRRQSAANIAAATAQMPPHSPLDFIADPQRFFESTRLPQTRLDAPAFSNKPRKRGKRSRIPDESPSFGYPTGTTNAFRLSDFGMTSSLCTGEHNTLGPERVGITDIGVNATHSLPYPGKHSNEPKKSSTERINDLILARLLRQVRLISEHFRRQEEETEISDDWTFVAMVLDRLFLVIFSILNFGTFLILIEAPTLHEAKEPLNLTLPTKPLGQADLYSVRGFR